MRNEWGRERKKTRSCFWSGGERRAESAGHIQRQRRQAVSPWLIVSGVGEQFQKIYGTSRMYGVARATRRPWQVQIRGWDSPEAWWCFATMLVSTIQKSTCLPLSIYFCNTPTLVQAAYGSTIRDCLES